MPHIHEKIDWCVGVYIVHNNKVLIRRHDKYNMWTHVGGYIELHEDPIQAGVRECKEEVGLDVTMFEQPEFRQLEDTYGYGESRELPAPNHLNIHRINATHQHIDVIYFARSESNVIVPENDTDEWLWLTEKEISQHPDISEKVKTYALNALKTLKT